MDEEREVQGVRAFLIVVLFCLTAALSFELWGESRQARFDSAWRTERNKFETYRRHRQHELARQLAAGEPAAQEAVEWPYEADM
jgi:hypothetical protein